MENLAGALNGNDSSFDPKTVSIMAPCFLDNNDMDAGAGNASQLFWSTSGWFNGLSAIGPETVEIDDDDADDQNGGDTGGESDGSARKKRAQVDSGALSISSFDVLDNIVDHYMDKSTYPNLEVIVHSYRALFLAS